MALPKKDPRCVCHGYLLWLIPHVPLVKLLSPSNGPFRFLGMPPLQLSLFLCNFCNRSHLRLYSLAPVLICSQFISHLAFTLWLGENGKCLNILTWMVAKLQRSHPQVFFHSHTIKVPIDFSHTCSLTYDRSTMHLKLMLVLNVRSSSTFFIYVCIPVN